MYEKLGISEKNLFHKVYDLSNVYFTLTVGRSFRPYLKDCKIQGTFEGKWFILNDTGIRNYEENKIC